MSSGIFISYRREESAGHAARLAERLQGKYDDDTVFFDESAIKPGQPFPESLKRALTEAEVVLVVIGSKWLTCKTAAGKRRIDDRKDWVKEEVRRALQPRDNGHRRLVIPVLVEGASVPPPTSLPGPLRSLSQCQAISFHGNTTAWEQALRELVDILDAKLDISSEERARNWLYDAIARRLNALSVNECRGVAEKLSQLTGEGAGTGFSPRALAKRFYQVGPAALTSLGQALRFDDSLRGVLELLKDYWVRPTAATELADAWLSNKPYLTTIVQGEQSDFTPKCVVQKASNGQTAWQMKPAASIVSQPGPDEVVSDIHEWLRQKFQHQRMRRKLPDLENEAVTDFLREMLLTRARSNEPIAVQLDETAAADKSLIRKIQTTFPYLRLLILTPDERGVHDLAEKYLEDLEADFTAVVHPETTAGDEKRAVTAYDEMADKFHQA